MALERRQEEHVTGFGVYFEGPVLEDYSSDFQQITVGETEGTGKYLLLDGLVMVTERDEHYYHESLVHPVARIIPQLTSVLVIGGGDGGTARELTKYGAQITLVEIDPEVMRMARKHLPTMNPGLRDPLVTIHVGDGCEFVANQQDEIYDLVVIDSSEPIGPNGTLFTQSFYSEIRRILRPGGQCVLQVGSPMYQQEMIEQITQKLETVFDFNHSYTGFTPSYPGGHWTFHICGEQPLDLNSRHQRDATVRWCTPTIARQLLHLNPITVDGQNE